jgi:voltage-gated potassium channel Kch
MMKVAERRVSRFQRDPLSIRNAVGVIVASTGAVVVVSALLMRFLDHDEYPHLGRALWWAMQTIPTVGYGDVTPARTIGRVIATVVMLWGIAFLSILTAVITSTFVARAAREHERELAESVGEEASDPLEQLATISARLDRIEQLLGGRGGEPAPPEPS